MSAASLLPQEDMPLVEKMQRFLLVPCSRCEFCIFFLLELERYSGSRPDFSRSGHDAPSRMQLYVTFALWLMDKSLLPCVMQKAGAE